MAKNFVTDAAYALRTAFAFTQSSHRTEDLPVVLIPDAAWPDFLSEAVREMAPAVDGVGFGFAILSGIRFQPASARVEARTKPLRPNDHPGNNVDRDERVDWTAYAGGEKHLPRVGRFA